jgi:hypothetical protein
VHWIGREIRDDPQVQNDHVTAPIGQRRQLGNEVFGVIRPDDNLLVRRQGATCA